MSTYHWTIDGVPACAADLPAGLNTTCAHRSYESAEADAARLLDVRPDAQVDIVGGKCPRPDQPCCYGYEGCHECCDACDVCGAWTAKGGVRCGLCATSVEPLEAAAFHSGVRWGAVLTLVIVSLALLGWQAWA